MVYVLMDSGLETTHSLLRTMNILKSDYRYGPKEFFWIWSMLSYVCSCYTLISLRLTVKKKWLLKFIDCKEELTWVTDILEPHIQIESITKAPKVTGSNLILGKIFFSFTLS